MHGLVGTESKKSPDKSRKLKKVQSLPVNVNSEDAGSDDAEKRVHRLSMGEV